MPFFGKDSDGLWKSILEQNGVSIRSDTPLASGTQLVFSVLGSKYIELLLGSNQYSLEDTLHISVPLAESVGLKDYGTLTQTGNNVTLRASKACYLHEAIRL